MLRPLRDFPLLRDSFNEGKSEGKAAGKAEALLIVLEARGFDVSDAAKQTILACSDCALLTVWLKRTVFATSLDEILA